MSVRGPRLEFAVGAFLLLALASLMVLAVATTNGKFGFGQHSYPLKARFTGNVILADIVAPESYTLSGEGKGGPAGHVRVSSRVRLTADGSATVLDYDVKADIGGKLAQLGGALVEKTAQKLAAEFFITFEQLVGSQEAGPAPPTEPDAAFNAAPATSDSGVYHTWRWLAAAVATMIVIGWLGR